MLHANDNLTAQQAGNSPEQIFGHIFSLGYAQRGRNVFRCSPGEH